MCRAMAHPRRAEQARTRLAFGVRSPEWSYLVILRSPSQRSVICITDSSLIPRIRCGVNLDFGPSPPSSPFLRLGPFTFAPHRLSTFLMIRAH
jgi:hypothetical protein